MATSNAIKLNGDSTVPVRMMVTNGSTGITSTNSVDTKIKDVLVAAFEAIPSQAGATTTVAAIVTALKTLP